jgi:hypothetical protein
LFRGTNDVAISKPTYAMYFSFYTFDSPFFTNSSFVHFKQASRDLEEKMR